MRVLILSCNTGEGHNSCAKALKEIFESKGHHCIIEDSLRFILRIRLTLFQRDIPLFTEIYRDYSGGDIVMRKHIRKYTARVLY